MDLGPNTLCYIENNGQDRAKVVVGAKETRPLDEYDVTKTTNKDTKKTIASILNRTMSMTLYGANKTLNIGYIPLFIYRAFEKSTKCPRIADPILKIPGYQLTRKIQNREITCEEVIQAYINRINEVNPILNAVIQDRFVEALEDARKVDDWIASDEFPKDKSSIDKNYPLLGLPITVKGSINVKGLKNTSGLVSRSDCIAEDDAVVVKQVKKAGAIPLVVSNVPELCMNWETTNNLVGSTRNPYDTTRSCGGSSGGEASLLGSGASLLGIGSDVAGSLRLPAHFCGVWSHKPTPKTVSEIGHYPSSSQRDSWESVFTLGGMSRYSKDLKPLLRILCKPEMEEALRLDEEVDVRNIKIYYLDKIEDTLCDRTNKACSLAVSTVVEHMKTISTVPPKKMDIPLFRHAAELSIINLISLKDVDHIFDNQGRGTFTESAKYLAGKSSYTFTTIMYGLLKMFYHYLPQTYKNQNETDLKSLRKLFEEVLGGDGVLIMPTYHQEAFKHGDALKNAMNCGYMSIFNALGFPVTNCPVQMTSSGMPVGIQVVGLPYSDRFTIAVGEEIEKAFGGWQEP